MFVGLADHAWALEGGQVEELLFNLPLHHRGFFLDHQEVGQPLGELGNARGFERVNQADLVDAHAGGCQGVRVQVQAAQHFQEVEMRLADGDDAKRG